MGLILGTGFPAWRGGILRWADEIGLASILEKCQRYQELGVRFQPTELLRQLADANGKFYP
jgi:3-hydroxyacyl-CoA dehydrogenase